MAVEIIIIIAPRPSESSRVLSSVVQQQPSAFPFSLARTPADDVFIVNRIEIVRGVLGTRMKCESHLRFDRYRTTGKRHART